MNPTVLEEIRRLSVAERLQLVADIWDSIAASPEEHPLTEGQHAELDRRLEIHRQNRAAGTPWEEVKQRLTRL